MLSLVKLMGEILLEESVSVNNIDDAIDNHKRVVIIYHSKGEDYGIGPRLIEVYAYGLTKAGNPVIRAFEPFGDTTSKIPAWKFFRLDRISSWKETNQTFVRPASDYANYMNLGDFNPDDDLTMSTVYKIATFDNDNGTDIISPNGKNGPKMKNNIYKTDTERNMERLRQQLQNPLKPSDYKIENGFGKTDVKPNGSGPKLKSQPIKPELYKTDTERNMERLRQQLQNPQKIDLDKFNLSKHDTNNDNIDTLRKKLGDTSKPMTMGDLNSRLSNTSSSKPELYKTDTERNMERLRQQLQNPQKIDLSKIH